VYQVTASNPGVLLTFSAIKSDAVATFCQNGSHCTVQKRSAALLIAVPYRRMLKLHSGGPPETPLRRNLEKRLLYLCACKEAWEALNLASKEHWDLTFERLASTPQIWGDVLQMHRQRAASSNFAADESCPCC
jgi:hypothetical protein